MSITLGELKENIEYLVNVFGKDILDVEVYGSSDYGDRTSIIQLNNINDIEVHKPKDTVYSETCMRIDDETTVETKNELTHDSVVVFV